jgi:outer membrane receptor protein involved in Fe transport
MSTRVTTLLTVIGLLLALSVPAMAQTTTGRIRGEVSDPDGTALPGAVVTLTSEALMGTRIAVTGETGAYWFTALPPGDYDVKAEMDGFQTRTIDGVRVSVGGVATADFTIHAEFAEQVTITGEAPLVNVASSSAPATYGADFIKDLPTARNFYDLMAVSPGVSLGAEDSDRLVAFGSNVQSNGWYIDGIETTAPETGTAWVSVNPDMVEEIQVLGVGAPAEFGNMLGAALNVVTKSGSNELGGTANVYWFDDSQVDPSLDQDDIEFPEYHQKEFWDATATLGGPFKKDRLWFFAAYEYWRDGHSFPGSDPETTPTLYSDRYDLKLSARINDKNLLDLKGYFDDWGFPAPASVFFAQSALAGEIGTTTAWGLAYQSILTDRTFLETRYSGWKSNDDYLSQTGSEQPAFIDYSPPGGGPTTFSGGVWYPWTYDTSTDQASVTASHFADDFLKGNHDFKFGVQLSQGDAITQVAPSATGTYYYHYAYDYYGTTYDYYYRVEGLPYFYGNKQDSWSAFVDDSWQVSDRLTLNLGVRFDHHEGRIPSFDRLDPFGVPTGETIPGVDPVFTWDNLSPRLGFAYNVGGTGRMVVRGSFGVYYDGNVSGNWNSPAPFAPSLIAYVAPTPDGPFEFAWDFNVGANNVNPDLKTPRTLQYALGFERQLKTAYSFGAMVVYKDTSDLIGWEILDDGVYEELPFTDPFTGTQYTLLNPVEFPTVRKGNQPGFTVNPNADEYWQEYFGVVLTFNRRLTDWWSMQASYTYSESKGLIPRYLSQWQFNPFYSAKDGADPNSFLNTDDLRLQGDRPHMFRVQANFELPRDFRLSTSVNLQSGRPYTRQVRLPTEGRPLAILEDDLRHPFQSLVDVGVGRQFVLGGRWKLNLDLQVFNLLNDDATDWFQTVELADGDTFVPTFFVKPRRLQLRVGLEF